MQLVTTILIALNAIIFLLMYKESGSLWNPPPDFLLRAGADYGPLVVNGQWWRIFCSGFVHIGLVHLIVNMYALSSLGGAVESQAGVIKYLIIYFVALVTGSLVSLYFHATVVSAGASGAIFGLLGCQLLSIIGCWKVMPKSQVISWLISDLIMIGLYFAIGFFFPQIDNFAHLGGFIGGLIASCILLPFGEKNKLPNLFNTLGLVALLVIVWFASSIVLQKVKSEPTVISAANRDEIRKLLKENKLPIWWPAQLLSPAETFGTAILQCSDYKTAIGLANKEVAISETNGEAYYTRALVNQKFNHPVEALNDVNKAISLVPLNYNFMVLKAQIELSQKSYEKAMRGAEAALKIERKEHSAAKDVIGCCDLARGHTKDAIDYFDKAISENPDSGAPYFHRALARENSSAKVKSQQDFIRAQEKEYVPSRWDEEFKLKSTVK